jgi:tetratricopeptide (TPR) repeat protein
MSARRLATLAALGGLLALAAPRPAGAAEDAGTLSPFASGAGCRALALGGAFVAVAEDAAALTWNPAGLARSTRSGFEAAHTDHTEVDAGDDYAALVMPSWRWGAAGLSFRHLGVGGIERRDDRNVLLDGQTSDSETEITLGYARPMSETWSLGAAVKMQRQSLDGFSAGAIGADVGVLVALGPALGHRRWLNGLAWGLAARNLLEPSLRLDQESVRDPRLWRSGLAWRGPVGALPDLRLALDMDQAAGLSPRLHAGVEARVHPLLALRGGFDDGRLTAGAGVTWHELDVSYAFQDAALGAVHRVGLSRSFGPTVSASRDAAHRVEEEALQVRLDDEFQRRRGQQLESLLARAEAARAERAYENALEILGAAALLDSSDARVTALDVRCERELGASLERAGDESGATLAYGRALAIAPGDTAAASGQRRAQLAYERRTARDATRRGRFAAALNAFAAGDLAAARMGLAALTTSDPADSQAVALLRRVNEAIAGQNAELARRARQDAQAPDEATVTPAPAPVSAENRRDAESFYRRGVEAMSAGRADDAVRFWELTLSLDPGHAGAGRALNREYLARGMEAYAAGRLDDAVSFWEKARRADPTDRRAAGFLARARERELRTRELSGR